MTRLCVAASVMAVAVGGSSLFAQTAPPARSTNPPYLTQFPSVDRVKTELTGANAMETAARQMGAFWQLQEIVKGMSGLRWTRNAMTPDEKRLIGEYAAAYQAAGKPYESYPDRPGWYKMHSFYETSRNFRDELFTRLLSPQVQALWAETTGDTRARVDASRAAREAEFKELQAKRDGTYIGPAPMSQRELARCLASGRTEAQCLEKREMGVVQEKFQALFDVFKNDPGTPGLSLSGIYSGAGNLKMEFGRLVASVACGEVAAGAGYRIERTGGQLQVRLLAPAAADKLEAGFSSLLAGTQTDTTSWQGQQIVLSLQADGRLAGKGPIRVTGRVAVGTRQGTRISSQTVYSPNEARSEELGGADVRSLGGSAFEVTKRVPYAETIYETRTRNCSLGVLAPTGKAVAMEVASSSREGVAPLFTLASDIGNLRNPFESLGAMAPEPGLRMQGTYAGREGFEIEFYPRSAVVRCGQVIEARDYSVSASGSRVLVSVRNGASSITLDLHTNGTLSGPGSIAMQGRLLAGVNMKDEPVFRAVSDSCTVAVLTPAVPGN